VDAPAPPPLDDPLDDPLDQLREPAYRPVEAFEDLPVFASRVKEAFAVREALTPAESVPAVGGPAEEGPESERDRQILALAREGRSQRQIAAEVAVSRSTVARVLRRYGPSGEMSETEAETERELVPA
jgi:DNA-binding CsgD family transcriptional regulator